ncbi:centrocin 2-like [Strongylocentrotus purpuratus]|uniref:Uncharacterized protein n=1 Tax=Strongylocentrotus purpuratus TaxID=7668 RepID=A0A7M7SWX8_STRPU|nr:centrocin 2-like [Strongylocentrotus purpuratus]
MMMKLAVVLCAIVATSIVCAKDFEEQDALDTLLNLMLSEEAASPDDAVALQRWFKHHHIHHHYHHFIHHYGLHRGLQVARNVCKGFAHSPEEARAKILAAIPEMKEEDLSEEYLRLICAGHYHHHHHGR